MDKYKQLIAAIASQTGTEFRPASSAALACLHEFKLPDAVLTFYALYEPAECAEGQVRLWPIRNMVAENRDAVPGCCVSPYGYIVFASTLCGDAYCFNLNQMENGEPQIVLIPHDALGEDGTAEQAARIAKPVARDLLEFLEQFSRGKVDEGCIY